VGLLLSLDDPAARDPDVVGFKVAFLARAAGAGLPVLPGVVLPLDASASALRAGALALGGAGSAAAYLAANAVEPPTAALGASLPVGVPLVVRSSTRLDDDGRWSGAFASYLDVGRGDLAAAVRGCWSSAFTRDVLERCAATDVDPSSVRIAVLMQPWVAFTWGGTARVDALDIRAPVTVTIGAGGAHGVVAGDDAATARVHDDGVVEGDVQASGDTIRRVARLARRALAATGVGTIEWGATTDGIVLLQVGPASRATIEHPLRLTVSDSVPRDAARVAAIVARFRGPVADELVLPWAFAADEAFQAPPIDVPDLGAALAEAVELAALATSTVWGEAGDHGADVVRQIRAGAVEQADLFAVAGRADPSLGRRIVGLISGIGEVLDERGILPAAEVVWQLTRAELEAAIVGTPPRSRGGPDRWEPFLVEAAFALGRTATGTPVAGGVGAGRLHVVTSLIDLGRPGPRTILAADAPLPQLAPLLWQCAGFVGRRGSAGAHLFEVAHSLGVPAVIGVAPSELGPEGSLVAVDGWAGVVASLDRPADADRLGEGAATAPAMR
jgi:hypothetical protein